MKYFDVNFAYYYYVCMRCVYGFPHLTTENAMNTAFVFATTGGYQKILMVLSFRNLEILFCKIIRFCFKLNLSAYFFLLKGFLFLCVVLLCSLLKFKHSKVGIRKERTASYVLRHILADTVPNSLSHPVLLYKI